MKRSIIIAIVLALLVWGVSASLTKNEKTASDPAVLATVNGSSITEDDRYLMLGGEHANLASPEARDRALEDLIDQELLYQNGQQLNLDKDVKYRNAVRIMEMRLQAFKRSEIARRVISTKIAASVSISNEDVRSFYEQNKKMITTELHLLILRFENEQEAAAVQARLQSGQSFVQAASRGSVAVRAASQRSDQGFLKWNQIPAEWTGQLYSLKKGEISPVLTSKRSGICIAQLVELRNDPDSTFERMSAGIMNRLRDIRITEAYNRYLSDLKKKAKISRMNERRNAS